MRREWLVATGLATVLGAVVGALYGCVRILLDVDLSGGEW